MTFAARESAILAGLSPAELSALETYRKCADRVAELGRENADLKRLIHELRHPQEPMPDGEILNQGREL